MRKFLICVTIIIMIIISTFIYKKFINNKDFSENNIVLSTDGDFLLYIDDILQDTKNLKIIGVISNGNINVNDEINIEGLGKKSISTKIIKIESDNNEITSAKAGDEVCITLDSNVDKEYIKKGQVAIIQGTMKPIYNIDARITSSNFKISEIKEKANIFFINSDINCSIDIISQEENQIKISLDVPIVIKEGLEFIIKNDNNTIAKGIIIE